MRGILFSCLHRTVCGWSKFASAGRVGFFVLFSLCVLTIAVVVRFLPVFLSIIADFHEAVSVHMGIWFFG